MKTLAPIGSSRQDRREERTFFPLSALAKITDTPGLDSKAKLVLFALLRFTNGRGLCWPSIETIADRTGLCTKSVNRALKALRSAGMVTVRKVAGPPARNVYDMSALGAVDEGTQSPVRGTLRPVEEDSPSQTEGLRVPQSDQDLIKNSSRVRARRLEPADQPPAVVADFLRRIT